MYTPYDTDSEFTTTLDRTSGNIEKFITNYGFISQVTASIIKKRDISIEKQLSNKTHENMRLSHEIQNDFHKLTQISNKTNMDIINKLIEKFNLINKKFIDLCAKPQEMETYEDVTYRDVIIDMNPANYQTLSQQTLISIPDDDQQVALINYRDREIKKILKDQMIINDMYKDIALILEQSSPLVNNIESNISNTVEDVIYANEQIKIAENNQKSYNKKLCWCALGCALILIIVLLIVILVVNPSQITV